MELTRKLAWRYEQLRSDRSRWDGAWKSLSELFLPDRYRSDTDTTAWQAPKVQSRLVNSAGVLAMRTLAAGMQGGMTSPVRPWFRLTLKGNEDEVPGVHEWLDAVTQAMQSVFHQSNFYNAIHGLYADLGTFGTGLLIETADADGLHFHLVRAGEYALDVNGRGEVDTFFRRMYLTARQIVDNWGRGDNVPNVVKQAAENPGGQSSRFDVIHAVFPRKDMKAGVRLGPQAKPYASVYFMPGGLGANAAGGDAVLDEGGYDMFPAFAPRWEVYGSDVYGRSPAMDVTSDCQMLQAMTKTLREMQHKIADPPLVADASLKAFGVRLAPSSLNYVDTTRTGMTAVAPIHQPEPGALQYTMQSIKDVEETVNNGLYVDLFRMLLDDDRRQITATEIQARQQEKMMLIGPVVERLHKELLEPLILRTFALMQEWGALPTPPPELAAAELDVSFESVLAQAQRMMATSAIDQGLAFVAQAAQLNPEVLDTLDMDALGRTYLDRIGMPEACVRDEQAVEELRSQRAEAQAAAQQQAQAQQQTQEMAAMAETASKAAKNMGETPVGADGETLLSSILGGIGGG